MDVDVDVILKHCFYASGQFIADITHVAIYARVFVVFEDGAQK